MNKQLTREQKLALVLAGVMVVIQIAVYTVYRLQNNPSYTIWHFVAWIALAISFGMPVERPTLTRAQLVQEALLMFALIVFSYFFIQSF